MCPKRIFLHKNKTLSTKTSEQYDAAVQKCRELFKKKTIDYGTSWRILRPTSLTDQIFIKAQRIRSIEEKQENKVGDSIIDEYIGIVNYCILAIVQLKMVDDKSIEMDAIEVLNYYDLEAKTTKELMLNKNHDYGEAWREMRVSTYTDLILMKILRIRQIENNAGKTLISEGLEANYQDMMNYAIFALIRDSEGS
ncbi:MAG: hypothetical protein ACI8ZN_000616 [Bacteroidia bacterium]|jgi:hypothetical protein